MTESTDRFTTPVALDRETFLQQLLASLGHLNDAILGSDLAGAYLMQVGLSIAITLRSTPQVLPVEVQRERVELVIANLLDNAVKYSPTGGEIVVTMEADGRWARLSIADQGIDIPKGDLPKLFTPFFRGSNAPSRNFGGLGLGLHLSQAILEAHGGSLAVHSVEGQTTTFTLSLPVVENAENVALTQVGPSQATPAQTSPL